MERTDLVGGMAMYGGSAAACIPSLIVDTSVILMMFSGLGALIAGLGFAYTVWNGNRNYKLAREQADLRRLELLNAVEKKNG